MNNDLKEKINSLLGDFTDLGSRIKHLEFNTDACGEKINVRCSYIAFRDGRQTFDDFIDVIANQIISFCLPRSEIREAQRKMSQSDHVTASRIMMQLGEKSRGLFIKAKKGSFRSGEAGEIVLYILTEWLLNAPQIVSKMYLKTNNQMPVHGTDGIHARFDELTNKLFLFWGESKAHVELASSLSDALDSISEFIKDGHDKREIEIVATHSDFFGFDEASKQAFLCYLDPYAPQSNERIVIHSCLLVFQYEINIKDKPETIESIFETDIRKKVEKFISTVSRSIESKNLNLCRFEFFLLPVPSVQEFRDKFQAKIGWTP